MKYLVLIAAAMFLAGCASTNQITVAEYDQESEQMLPPVTVFLQHPSEAFRKECEDFDSASFLNHCKINRLDLKKFASELSDAGMFDEVFYADKEIPYQIRITSAIYNTEGGDDITSAVIAGGTMMLAPMIISADIKVDASLYWYEYQIAQFQYDLPVQFRASLLNLDQDTDRDIAKSVASHILRDIQSQDMFSPQYLAAALNASDYDKDFSVPEVVGKYLQQQTLIFNNPLYGAYVLYETDSGLPDYIEVFVYPVRAASWLGDKSILQKEIVNAKKDLEIFNEDNALELTNQSDDAMMEFKHPEATLRAVMFENELLDNLSNEYGSQTYVMIMEDKFFKVRHTALKDVASRTEVDDAIAQLVQDSEVPKESPFMARLRKQFRDSE